MPVPDGPGNRGTGRRLGGERADRRVTAGRPGTAAVAVATRIVLPEGGALAARRCTGAGSPGSPRRRPRCHHLLVLFLFLLSLALPAEAADPWYADLKGHWAEDEVRVLWEEGVTDGYPREDALGRWQWLFLPNAFMERAQFAVLLAKVMGLAPDPQGPPVYRDVPPEYVAGGGLEAFPWIQAGGRAGIFSNEPGGRFRPAEGIRRDEAAAMLVHALDLGWYADSLPEDRLQGLLGRYVDAQRVRPELRRAVAAALDLAIMVGYGDGYLRPDRPLTRAEGATLIYKSALMRVGAEPPVFSPDGDGQDEQTTLEAQALLNRNQVSWQVELLDVHGTVRYRWTGTRLPARWSWDGHDEQGRPLPAGLYLLRGVLTARQGARFLSAVEPVQLVYHRLAATASPVVVEPGEPVRVTALTEGPVQQVALEPPGTGARPMIPVAPGRWEAAWTVPAALHPGTYPLVVRAAFPPVHRQQTLYVQVLPTLWIRGWAEPNPAAPGSAVTVRAETPAGATRVVLDAPGEVRPMELEPDGPGRWIIRWTVPAGVPPGTILGLGLEAHRGSATARTTLPLEVGGTPRGEPVFHLSH
ncbi:S-layer homology domain-containing protein [Thermaerobacter sp. PB12/4term]|uniref:S-layer homology domain-containing protein n=1 Tax=Thermaerobacter sp. PB12/4term TaxID=2293838 RepID=UPI000E32BA2A|nr:S-layer homology domain-containing protein [Thermaerobacter sp. PB12/4term]QIA27130.1 S-layer homology domain-containing protein [Thermaerobacter sp. PB12/4term]